MGMSASQSRLLTLTARLSDLELKAQNIQHQKVRLAEQSTEAAKTYMNALDAQNLMYNSAEYGKVAGTVANITASDMYRIADTNGNYFYCSDKDTTTVQSFTTPGGNTFNVGSDGSLRLSTPNNTMTVQNGVLQTITKNGTIMANGTQNPIYVSANRNITVMNGTYTSYNELSDEITKNDSNNSNFSTAINANKVTRSFILNPNTDNQKKYSYEVSADNTISFGNVKVTKTQSGFRVCDTDDSSKYYDVDTSKDNSSTFQATSLNDSGSVDTTRIGYTANGGLVVITNGITYTIKDNKMSIKDGSTNVISNDTIANYVKDSTNATTESAPGNVVNEDPENVSISIGSTNYYINSNNKVYSSSDVQQTLSGKIVVGIAGSSVYSKEAGCKFDTYQTYNSENSYKSGSIVEYTSGSNSLLKVTNNSNGSSVQAGNDGFIISDTNTNGLATVTSVVKNSDGSYSIQETVAGNTTTYTIETNNTCSKITCSDVADPFILNTIQKDTWVLRGQDGSFKTVNKNNMTDAKWLLDQLQSANLFIQKYDIDKGTWGDYSYLSSSLFTTEDDDKGLAQAEAEYEARMAEIQHKDKKLDLELDNIETEHTAIDTQIESVQGIVDKNIEKTFKIFG